MYFCLLFCPFKQKVAKLENCRDSILICFFPSLAITKKYFEFHICIWSYMELNSIRGQNQNSIQINLIFENTIFLLYETLRAL